MHCGMNKLSKCFVFLLLPLICQFNLLSFVNGRATRRANKMVIVTINKNKYNVIVTIVVIRMMNVEVCV